MIGKIPEELMGAILETLPVDINVIDADDKLIAWTKQETRLFKIPEKAEGQDIRKCHPPQVVAVLENLLKEMREGKRDKAIVWGPLEGKMTVTGYYALRDKDGKYIGCMEVDQDITEIQKLEGSKHTID